MSSNRDNKNIYKSLLPFAWLYNAGVWTRNKLFDRGILSVEEFSIPIISVGNLTVGGTGKTPMIAYLIELLSPHKRVAVLSRGYRRRSKGFRLATQQTTAQEIGDEPYQLYCKYPHVVVAVDGNRRRGIETLLQLPCPPEVILLDDAHQHRHVRPSLSIVLCDYNRPIYNDLPLPAGRLREPMSGLKRADIVVLTKTPRPLSQEELRKEAEAMHYPIENLFASHIEYDTIYHLVSKKEMPTLSIEKQQEIIVLCGIVNPQPMIDYLSHYSNRISLHAHPDHHYFTATQLQQIGTEAAQHNAIIVTTEKDAARLHIPTLPKEVAQRCYVLPMHTVIETQANNRSFDAIVKEIAGI